MLDGTRARVIIGVCEVSVSQENNESSCPSGILPEEQTGVLHRQVGRSNSEDGGLRVSVSASVSWAQLVMIREIMQHYKVDKSVVIRAALAYFFGLDEDGVPERPDSSGDLVA